VTEPFTWRDGERTIAFGRGRVAEAGELLGNRFLLLTTERARGDAPGVAALAAQVVHVARRSTRSPGNCSRCSSARATVGSSPWAAGG
jgi:hypothetical protein